jgi:choice-of-anchor B domain-containing protein
MTKKKALLILFAALALAATLIPAPVATAQDPAGPAQCKNSRAGDLPCKGIDVVGRVTGTGGIADVWGWVDPETKDEFAIVGGSSGPHFFNVTNPAKPVDLGSAVSYKPPAGLWLEMEILNDHLYWVCDLTPCGLNVFDLTRLTGPEAALPVWRPDVHLPLGTFHSIDSNPKTNHIFLNGFGISNPAGTPIIFDVSTPLAPTPVGAMADDGYTHDSLCRNYRGNDKDHKGDEICFNFNEDSVTIYNVTDNPQQPVQLSRNPYEGAAYTHSGALTDDHNTLISTDEGDETSTGGPSTLFIWDVRDLDKPKLIDSWEANSLSIDHNVYSEGDALFHANYNNGLRILDLSKAHKGKLKEVAWIDTMPVADSPSFEGAWAAYPFLPSGNILIGDMSDGFFIVRPEPAVLKKLGIGKKRATMSSL